MSYLSQAPSFILLILGFGFVVFFHELGHFLAAKWAGVKVEQFAVGFGSAICSYRRGLGFTWGSSGTKLEAMTPEEREKVGETEYRWNWLPLGGYVKMLGQDDLKVTSSQDPRSYNMKSIGARMVIVSAGVVMNIILAIIGFTILFRTGFSRPPSVIGSILPGSPAQRTYRDDKTPAPLQVGDRIIMLDGKEQLDFTKISLEAALMQPDVAAPMKVQRRDGTEESLWIKPTRNDSDPKGFVVIGIGASPKLEGAAKKDGLPPEMRSAELLPPDVLALKSGDVIKEVNGQPVKEEEYYKLDEAIQNSGGRPVKLTVRTAEGQTTTLNVQPHFDRPFGNDSLNFAGMLPRPAADMILYDSPARGKLMPGDVITGITTQMEGRENPTAREFTDWLKKAGDSKQPVEITVLRDGKSVKLEGIIPSFKIKPENRWGLGISLAFDDQHAVVAGTQENSPARKAEIPDGATLTQVAGHPVVTWSDVRQELQTAKVNEPIEIKAKTARGEDKTYSLTVGPEQLTTLHEMRYGHNLQLQELTEARKTTNPFIAAQWGTMETRDFVLEFYRTLRSMFRGSVGVNNMMGPVGMVAAGTKLATRGNDWLIWFLSLISANLAVVNFLPIPIVDGGLFMFLLLEKVKGSPLSPKAQSIAQVVGLALLLGVFLLVTYQDITRLF